MIVAPVLGRPNMELAKEKEETDYGILVVITQPSINRNNKARTRKE